MSDTFPINKLESTQVYDLGRITVEEVYDDLQELQDEEERYDGKEAVILDGENKKQQIT